LEVNWIRWKRFCIHLPATILNVPGTAVNHRNQTGGAHLDTTAGTQPSRRRVVIIAPCWSVNAAFLFGEPRLVALAGHVLKVIHGMTSLGERGLREKRERDAQGELRREKTLIQISQCAPE